VTTTPISPEQCKPLSDIRVLDLTQVIAGPFCTMMLANLGAEVVKIEVPGRGDDLRLVGRYPGRERHEDYFNAANNSKKSIALDLKQPAHQSIAHALAKRADIVVENFAPGTASRLGMGWSDLHALNPRLLYCSISGFGQSGPYSDRLGMDPIIQAISGVMSVTGQPHSGPIAVGAPLADVISGMFGAYAIVGVLHEVKRSGRGRHIDVSMQAAMLAALGPRMGGALNANIVPERIGNQNPMRMPSDVYPTRDDAQVYLMVHHDRFWPGFCRAVERPEWIEAPHFANNRLRCEHRAELNRLVMERFASYDGGDITSRLALERVPHALVNDYVQALDDPQVRYRGQVQQVVHRDSGAIRVVGPPWLIDRCAGKVGAPPKLDEHRNSVLRDWLELSDDEIARLGDRGIEENA
jgi:crotonobetainyl-CoA:carnitine CoA-transferase CaiB-like acyl-CoA transferase